MTPYSSIKTKAGRNKIKRTLEELAATKGLHLETLEIDPRSIDFTFARGGHRLLIDIDATCNVGCFLLHWYSRDGAKYPDGFAGGYSVNQFHHGKATGQADTLEEVVTLINNGFDQLLCIEAGKLLLGEAA